MGRLVSLSGFNRPFIASPIQDASRSMGADTHSLTMLGPSLAGSGGRRLAVAEAGTSLTTLVSLKTLNTSAWKCCLNVGLHSEFSIGREFPSHPPRLQFP